MSRSAVDRLGERLRKSAAIGPEDAAAYSEYRAGFSDALGEIQEAIAGMGLPLLGQTARLKTLESTQAKLQRESIRLSQIQDIAGCRVTVRG